MPSLWPTMPHEYVLFLEPWKWTAGHSNKELSSHMYYNAPTCRSLNTLLALANLPLNDNDKAGIPALCLFFFEHTWLLHSFALPELLFVVIKRRRSPAKKSGCPQSSGTPPKVRDAKLRHYIVPRCRAKWWKKVQSQNSPREYLKESSPRMRPCFRSLHTHRSECTPVLVWEFRRRCKQPRQPTHPLKTSARSTSCQATISLEFSFFPSTTPPTLKPFFFFFSAVTVPCATKETYSFSCLWLSQLPCMTNWFQTLTLGFPARRLCLERELGRGTWRAREK